MATFACFHRITSVAVVSVAVFCTFALWAHPTYATGNYYVDTTSGDALDTNSCRTVNDPCATLSGVVAVISASANPENSTVHFTGTVTEEVDIQDADLRGLTIVGDKNNLPVIDATGNSYGVYVRTVDDVTLKHIEVTGAEMYGVFGQGGSDTYLNGFTVTDVRVHDFTGENATRTGITVSYADNVTIENSTVYNIGYDYSDGVSSSLSITGIFCTAGSTIRIRNNTVRDIAVTYAPVASATTVYTYLAGIEVTHARDLSIRGNTVRRVTATNTVSTAAAYAANYAQGIYVYNVVDGAIRGNIVRTLSAESVATDVATSAFSTVYGLYAHTLSNMTIRNNTWRTVGVTTSATADRTSSPTLYGMYMTLVNGLFLEKNMVRTIASTGDAGQGTAFAYGLYFLHATDVDLLRTTVRGLTATFSSTTGHSNATAVYVNDVPKVNLAHSRFANFSATVADDTGTYIATSIGVDLHYNAGADMVNNLVYNTASPDASATVEGIRVNSAQATPVRAYHNTFNNMTVCVDIIDMTTLVFMNNLCRFTTSGAIVYAFDSDTINLDDFSSNNNAFYTTEEGTLTFTDTAVGSMTFADWKSTYNKDGKSLHKNPRVKLAHPEKRGYLHLKADSPLIDSGKTVAFANDELMQSQLMRDWDGQARPFGSASDIGVDEVQ